MPDESAEHDAASPSFCAALRYVIAANRCSRWRGDEAAERQLGRLAAAYRARAESLVMKDEF